MPLVAVERILGVIYLSSPASSPAFGEDHAYFLSAVSRIAAVTLENLSKLDSLKAENQRLQAEAKADRTLIGESRPMQRVSEFIGRVARGDSTVLIRGESGTGKELVARAIHANSLATRQAVRRCQLRRDTGSLAGERTLRPRKGSFHWRGRDQEGQVRHSWGGDAVPRRNRGTGSAITGQALAGLAAA